MFYTLKYILFLSYYIYIVDNVSIIFKELLVINVGPESL